MENELNLEEEPFAKPEFFNRVKERWLKKKKANKMMIESEYFRNKYNDGYSHYYDYQELEYFQTQEIIKPYELQ